MPTLKIPDGETYCEGHGLRSWKGREHPQASSDCVNQFLGRHTRS
jgi:hypothetical protein